MNLTIMVIKYFEDCNGPRMPSVSEVVLGEYWVKQGVIHKGIRICNNLLREILSEKVGCRKYHAFL